MLDEQFKARWCREFSSWARQKNVGCSGVWKVPCDVVPAAWVRCLQCSSLCLWAESRMTHGRSRTAKQLNGQERESHKVSNSKML
jgi:hypothetical protein